LSDSRKEQQLLGRVLHSAAKKEGMVFHQAEWTQKARSECSEQTPCDQECVQYSVVQSKWVRDLAKYDAVAGQWETLSDDASVQGHPK